MILAFMNGLELNALLLRLSHAILTKNKHPKIDLITQQFPIDILGCMACGEQFPDQLVVLVVNLFGDVDYIVGVFYF